MQKNDLQNLQDRLQIGGIPFAFWSLPGSKNWEGIAQNDKRFDSFDASRSEGFIIKGFNDDQKIRLIRSDLRFDSENLDFDDDLDYSNGKSIELPKEISQDEYLQQCRSFIDEINTKTVEKVVLSRVKKEVFKNKAAHLFLRLVDEYPAAMVFMYFVEDHLWIGATPETLLTIEGKNFETMALAGSRRTGGKYDWSRKEIEEQAYVERHIEKQLKKHNIEFKTKGPDTIKAGPIEHLCTKFKGQFEESKFLDVLNDLHPTPAVCGIPVEAAKEMIERMESHKRLDYTGFIGPVSKIKKQLFVNLRSAMIVNHSLYLFLGGGITKDSIPEEEWKETELKAETLLRMM